MRRWVFAGGAVALAIGVTGCGSETGVIPPPPPPPPGPAVTGSGPFVVSNPVSQPVAAVLNSAGGDTEGRVFVSLRPGALPDVSVVSFRVLRTQRVSSAALQDGGLDPFPVVAAPGDTIVVTVVDGGVPSLVFVVPERTPPVIIRTVPPKGTRDVALNTRLGVVFSEPVGASVLSDGLVTLRRGENLVPGQVRFADAAHTVVEFVPDAELAAATTLELMVDGAVRDLEGSMLGTTETLQFTTVAGPAAPPPPPPSITDWTIAFVRAGQIHVATPTGEQQLTVDAGGTAHNFDPVWSPDGARIAYVSGGVESQSIYLMNHDGTNRVRLTHGQWDGSPVWSPDGRSIVYTTHRDGSQAIVRISVEAPAAEPEVLLNLPGWDEDPALSPDGRTLLFTTDWRAYDFLGDLYAITIGDQASFHPVLLVPGIPWLQHYVESTWSPDGQYIAFTDCPDAGWMCSRGGGFLSIVRPDGTGHQALAQAFGMASPSWSPTGSHLAYTSWSCAGAAPCIRAMPVSGGAWVELINGGSEPAWRPR